MDYGSPRKRNHKLVFQHHVVLGMGASRVDLASHQIIAGFDKQKKMDGWFAVKTNCRNIVVFFVMMSVNLEPTVRKS